MITADTSSIFVAFVDVKSRKRITMCEEKGVTRSVEMNPAENVSSVIALSSVQWFCAFQVIVSWVRVGD